MAAYATSADMVNRFDERTLKELVSDDDTPVTSLSTDTKMTSALDDATGTIKAALFVGRQYDPDDLTNLTGESQAFLKRLCCEIALSYLLRRRPEKYGKASKEVRDGVEEVLEQIRKGVRVLDIEANLAAGLPDIDGPSFQQYQNNIRFIPDRTRHFYPSRQERLPLGR